MRALLYKATFKGLRFKFWIFLNKIEIEKKEEKKDFSAKKTTWRKLQRQKARTQTRLQRPGHKQEPSQHLAWLSS
jgi:hypothetical protein